MSTKKQHTILVGIDYTKSSENALNYALHLAERFNTKVMLLHVFEFPVMHTNSGLYVVDYKAIKKHDLEKLEKVKAKALKNFPNATIECINTTDTLKSFIKDLASKKKVDYVVMGLQTKDKISKLLYSTTGVNLSTKIDCPIIIVPEKYTQHDLVHAVITVDNIHSIKKQNLDKALTFTKHYKCNSKLVHIQTQDEFMLVNHKNAQKEKAKWDVRTIQAEDFGKGIAKYIKDNKADMVVMFSHAHSVFYSLFNESNTKQIAFNAKIPVMAIHE
ncbi:MAG: universal stress protein [Sphingobacteriaceae bacterium]|jgi:nucleotide-binding universal stress UspA family protein